VPDIASLFEFTVHPGELVLRGTLMYWFLFLLLRFVTRRDIGSVGVADILLLVLIADASQNAMAGGYTSVIDGCILVATIAGWNWLLDWAAYRFLSIRRMVEPKPLALVREGKLLLRNLRREMITVDELMSKMREHGIDNLKDVKAATMESDGEISVISREDKAPPDGGAGKRKVPG
jgi:Predicted membrane protein